MSVLCSRIPDVALALATRRRPGLTDGPVALLGPTAEVCGLSAPARQAGVQMGMTSRQAHLRCPELTLLEADLDACRHAQDAFVAELAQWELPVEAHGMGMAYIDLHRVTTARQDVQGLAADLGRRLRRTLGDDLQPALGWDHSKFCARAAAFCTPAGRMKLVTKEHEVAFLAPLTITLLPLPRLDLQRLHWLGITTLGQFAAPPSAAVWQQFGKAGQLAHRWAQGNDNRPVQHRGHTAWSPLEVEFCNAHRPTCACRRRGDGQAPTAPRRLGRDVAGLYAFAAGPTLCQPCTTHPGPALDRAGEPTGAAAPPPRQPTGELELAHSLGPDRRDPGSHGRTARDPPAALCRSR